MLDEAEAIPTGKKVVKKKKVAAKKVTKKTTVSTTKASELSTGSWRLIPIKEHRQTGRKKDYAGKQLVMSGILKIQSDDRLRRVRKKYGVSSFHLFWLLSLIRRYQYYFGKGN